MDLEGNDGRERDDDTVFERQVSSDTYTPLKYFQLSILQMFELLGAVAWLT